MLSLHDGQCGLCAHFGENAPADQPRIVQIRINGEAPEDMLEPCGLPDNAGRHLKVSPISGCDGFTPAKSA
jgi:hypothetical protein